MRSVLSRSCLLLAALWCPQFVHANSIRLATYNLNNYLAMDRHVGTVWRPSYPKPEAAKTVIRQVIRQALPDILAVQEIGTLPFLEELRADLGQEGVHYPYAIHLAGADQVRHVAVLSKFPPVAVVKHNDLDFKYQNSRKRVKRGMLELMFERSDSSVFKLFVVHLKSRWTDVKADPGSQQRRSREAEACRNRIIERSYDLGVTDFMVVGTSMTIRLVPHCVVFIERAILILLLWCQPQIRVASSGRIFIISRSSTLWSMDLWCRGHSRHRSWLALVISLTFRVSYSAVTIEWCISILPDLS